MDGAHEQPESTMTMTTDQVHLQMPCKLPILCISRNRNMSDISLGKTPKRLFGNFSQARGEGGETENQFPNKIWELVIFLGGCLHMKVNSQSQIDEWF